MGAVRLCARTATGRASDIPWRLPRVSMSMKFCSAMPRVFVLSLSLLFCLISEKTVASHLAPVLLGWLVLL